MSFEVRFLKFGGRSSKPRLCGGSGLYFTQWGTAPETVLGLAPRESCEAGAHSAQQTPQIRDNSETEGLYGISREYSSVT